MAIAGLEILMSKLQVLYEQVSGMGFECDVIGITDDLPRAQMYIRDPEEEDITVYDTVQITFIPPEDDSFSRFLINAVTELPIEDEDYRGMQAACDVLNLTTTGGFACIGGNYETVVYRAMLYEAGEPVSDKAMGYFLESYVQGLKTLRQLMAHAS